MGGGLQALWSKRLGYFCSLQVLSEVPQGSAAPRFPPPNELITDQDNVQEGQDIADSGTVGIRALPSGI